MLSCLSRVCVQEKKLTCVGLCGVPTLHTERQKETFCKVNEDSMKGTLPSKLRVGRSCVSVLSKEYAVDCGSYVIEWHHARTNATWLPMTGVDQGTVTRFKTFRALFFKSWPADCWRYVKGLKKQYFSAFAKGLRKVTVSLNMSVRSHRIDWLPQDGF